MQQPPKQIMFFKYKRFFESEAGKMDRIDFLPGAVVAGSC
jgi:hypothetical protein